MRREDVSWKAKAAAKRASTYGKIPQQWRLDQAEIDKASRQRNITGPFIEQYLTTEEILITREHAVGITDAISNRQYTSVQVVGAFCKRAAIAHQINNCLHEIFFDQALQRAKELDEYLRDKKATLGPVHGLPISLKDQFHVKGNDTSMGYIGWLDTFEGNSDVNLVHKVNSQTVEDILSLGAVLYCKIPGETTYPSSVGFLSSTQDALSLIMRSLLASSPWERDPKVIPIPWRQDIVDETILRSNPDNGSASTKLPLKLGVLWSDGAVTPQPPIQRGLKLVVEAVKKAGHKIVEWKPPSQSMAKGIHVAFLTADGGHNIAAQLDLSGEPLVPPLRKGFKLKEAMPVNEYQELTVEGRRYEETYLDYWNSFTEPDGQIVDAVIMPVAPHAAVIPGRYYHTAYTEAINLMDYTSTVIPVTAVNKDVDKFDHSYKPLSDFDKQNWDAYRGQKVRRRKDLGDRENGVYDAAGLLMVSKDLATKLKYSLERVTFTWAEHWLVPLIIS
ncbi:MAG: hypothetical protein Q9159_004630 [Coniocarpon cinnabarinum]